VLTRKLIHADIPTMLQLPHNFHELANLRGNVFGAGG